MKEILSSLVSMAPQAGLCAVACEVAENRHPNTLREDVHFRVMRLPQRNSEMSQRDLADEVGVSLGRVHYVLRALVDKGFVKTGNFRASNDKRRYA